MSEVHWIRTGIEFDWHGARAVIRKVGANVAISAPDGSDACEVPVAEIAAALRGPASERDLSPLHEIEQRLSPEASTRLRQDSELLHLMLTGRRTDQPDSERPPADLDPQRAPTGDRRRRLAALLAQQPRSKGSRRGLPVQIKSEMRRLQRIAKRWEEEQNLLDPRYSRPRKHRTSDAVMDALLNFLNDHALKSTKTDMALVRSFRIACATQTPELSLPSDTTLRRRVKELRAGWSHLGATAKNRISELNVPESSGMTRLATRPGELVLFDTTKANVWVRDPRTLKPVRLDVTLAIDLATRCIVGLAITHSTPQLAIGLCLADVLRPKTPALAREWATDEDPAPEEPFIGRPSAFLPFYSQAFHPEGVVVDNGKQYVSTYLTAQMARLGIHFEPQRSYSPTDKPQVERVFRTIKDMFESLMPGFTGGSVHERGKAPHTEELLTADMYERRLRQCIDLYNHRTHDGLVLPQDPFTRLSPYLMYGILTERAGAIPDVHYQHEWIRFLPTVTVKIRPSKVRVRRLEYNSPSLRKLQGDPMVIATGRLRVYYDPFDLRTTWCFDADGHLHTLRWHLLTPETPRFGELHTTHLVQKFADKKISTETAERILVDIFAGKYDNIGLESTRDDLLRTQTMALTASAMAAIEPGPQSQATEPDQPSVSTEHARAEAAPIIISPTSQRMQKPIQAEPPAPPRPRRALHPYVGSRP